MPVVKTQNNIFIIKPVLGLAGMELIFFIEACMVLRFRFVTRTVLITHQCFSYCWTVLEPHQGLLFLTVLFGARCGVQGVWGNDELTGVWPAKSVVVIPVQLGPTTRNKRVRKPSNWGIGRGICRGAAVCSSRWFLKTVKERYSLREALVYYWGKWTSTEGGIQCLTWPHLNQPTV